MGLDNEQDIRRNGALNKFFPGFHFVLLQLAHYLYIGFLILRGFYSKESIFEHLYVSGLPFSGAAYIYALLGFCVYCRIIQCE